ncbi:dipeptide ABC transporter ATP-binding protein [Herbaspirillum chlorophenolicum]|uniref:Dipeptide ABC transporter ATP-binding protein n=2 Tax=Herbaspirillum chlorophenolicum TaxID=211589 RepID=A0ABW8ETG1_9BURK
MNMTDLQRETSRDAVLSIRDLTVINRKSGRNIVERINVDIRPGETVCVVGESGSGKSVTSLAVMGLLPQHSLAIGGGEIWLAGENIAQASASRLRQLRACKMAMVFQEPMTALNPVMTIGAQLDEVLRIHSRLPLSKRREKVMGILEAVHLPDVPRIVASYPHQLSGGQRQRVVIAMALVLEPQLLIADEPTTALDVTTQKQILRLIDELRAKHNTAVLFITHDFGTVSEIADRVVVMNSGKVVETGNRAQILAEPRERYTRLLISSVPSLIPKPEEALSDEVVLQVSGLDKQYGKKTFFSRKEPTLAVSNVDLALRKGEVLGIVGESGSGKSTVARCIMRLIEPSGGQVLLNGENMAALRGEPLRQLRRRIQIVFQDPYRSLNPRQPVGESIIEGPLNFGTERAVAWRKAADLMRTVGLSEEVMNRYPHQFSGGQRQRICIARALAMEPSLLVADEAVSALDVSVQAEVLKLLREIRERTGIAILFITHDLRVAAQICDTIAVMQRGRVVEFGAAHQVLANPADSYTRKLIDAAPGRDWDFQNFRPYANQLVSS